MSLLTKNDDLPAVRKVLLLVLVGFCLFNHTIRLASGGASAELESFSIGGFLPSMVDSLNEFRLAIGSWIGSAENICPRGASKYCAGLLYGVKVVLGVH